MVARLAGFVFAITLFGVAPVMAVAAPKLDMALSTLNTQLGIAIEAELRGSGLSQDLSQIDLAPLERNFGVEIVETYSATEEVNIDAVEQQIMLLKLYPRTTGNLLVPSMWFSDTATATITVRVEEAKDKEQPITVASVWSSTAVWQRQQIIVQASIHTPQRFAALEVAPMRIDGMDVIALEPSRQWLENGDKRESLLQMTWLMFPTLAGEREIDLPALLYSLHGRVQRQFYLPKVKISVKPLPPYIPPTMAVGTVELSSARQAGGILFTGRPVPWQINISSKDLPPQWLPAVLNQMASNDQLKLLAVQSQRNMQPNTEGVHGQVVHMLQYAPQQSGLMQSPSLRVQYFDPESARIVNIQPPVETLFVVNKVGMIVVLVIVLILSLFSLMALYKKITSIVLRQNQKKLALQSAQYATDFWGLREAFKSYAKAMGWPDNESLSSWCHRWKTQYGLSPDFEKTVTNISAACYGGAQELDIDAARLTVLEQLRSPRKK